jgi:hypothetical protein
VRSGLINLRSPIRDSHPHLCSLKCQQDRGCEEVMEPRARTSVYILNDYEDRQSPSRR